MRGSSLGKVHAQRPPETVAGRAQVYGMQARQTFDTLVKPSAGKEKEEHC